MSLDFDFTKMIERLGKEEYDRLTDHPTVENQWHPVTDAIIWCSMTLDMKEIKEDNIAEWVWRYRFDAAVYGRSQLVGHDGPIHLTEQDFRNHIGLKTNMPQKSRAAFISKFRHLKLDGMPKAKNEGGLSAFDTTAAHIQKHKDKAKPHETI